MQPAHFESDPRGPLLTTIHTVREAPAQHFSAIPVHDHGEVNKTALHRQIAIDVSSGYDSRIIVGTIGNFPDILKKTLFFSMIDNFGCPPGHFDTVLVRKVCKVIGGDHAEFSSPLVNKHMQKSCRESDKMKTPRFEAWIESSLSEQFRNRIVLTG